MNEESDNNGPLEKTSIGDGKFDDSSVALPILQLLWGVHSDGCHQRMRSSALLNSSCCFSYLSFHSLICQLIFMESNFQSIVRRVSKAHKFNTLFFSAYKESILTIEWLAHYNSYNS